MYVLKIKHSSFPIMYDTIITNIDTYECMIMHLAFKQELESMETNNFIRHDELSNVSILQY